MQRYKSIGNFVQQNNKFAPICLLLTMSKEKKQTRISEIGEFGLIDRLTGGITIRNESTVKGVGDDAAVMEYPGKCIVMSTDLLTEGIHFNLMYVPLRHLGYKSVIVNLSDIYAMNAHPKQITVSIAISNKFSVEAVEEIYAGINLACEKYGIDLVGGDTTSSLTGLTICVSVIGEAEKEKLVYRSGAHVGDLLYVSGDLGGAYMGLQLLERENEVFKIDQNMQPRLQGYDYILGRQLKPEARADIVDKFEKMGIKPTSMIDISDGLSSEILHLCKKSGVGCRLFEEKVPMDDQTKMLASEMNINPLVAALNGGEDYELLFTLSSEDSGKVKNDPDFTCLGEITNDAVGAVLVTAAGSQIPLTAQGWNHGDTDRFSN